MALAAPVVSERWTDPHWLAAAYEWIESELAKADARYVLAISNIPRTYQRQLTKSAMYRAPAPEQISARR